MKNQIYYFLLLLFAVLISSCSDWEQDPTAIIIKKTQVVEETVGVLSTINFPKKISALYLYNESLFIAGTRDGYFYKSTDEGETWTLVYYMLRNELQKEIKRIN